MTSFGRQFGLNAATYDNVRPGYPDELFDMLADILPTGATVLEIGAGTGIATRELLGRGLRVLAVEPDDEMARQLSRQTVGDLEVVITDFESYRGARRSFDAVVSAQAWHWFAGAWALRCVKRLLRHDGIFAAWWNIGTVTDDRLGRELAAVFQETSHRLPVLFRRPDLNETIDELARLLHGDLGFSRVEPLRYLSSVQYEPWKFVALMSTMSEVLVLESDDRERVLGRLSDRLGDQVLEVEYMTLGHLAFRC
ncbi:class I SAM-dependent methyltransferase [Ferrimicrobium acidiphilum]|uniref:class I SAM-dependent methyltransferase n=1 Tax=Ferrimicrobium acidiphilum TaxID=121039 RepID=UPI0023F4BC3F|nr:class I SAM-dependent methyltransferase [Ferrimicrobium acidiphilum]